jgi:predicted YcjX-like family ATPase
MSGALGLSDLFGRRHVRVGVTGLARAGKTAFLTSVAANLLAQGGGIPALPAIATRPAGRAMRVAVAPAGADEIARFDYPAHLAALAADPPRWPERTGAASMLALDLDIAREAIGALLPSRGVRLEFLDYPGEWLLDLPLLGQDFARWSEATLHRLETAAALPLARDFLAFVGGLPASAPADETLAATGHSLYRATLRRLRDELGLSYLQPGRFLMPAPGPAPPFAQFFPLIGRGGLAGLLQARFDAYRQAVSRDLVSPLFGQVDRLVVLADVLAALHAGQAAFADVSASLSAVAESLRWHGSWLDAIPLLRDLPLPSWLTPAGIRRVAFAATKVDHVAERQRGNLANLVRALSRLPDAGEGAATASFAIAAVRCTEDFVWTLEGRNVSAVRGRVLGQDRLTRSYPGEVPDRLPDPSFWTHPFLALPAFEPRHLPSGGRAGVTQIGLDALLAFLLEDIL